MVSNSSAMGLTIWQRAVNPTWWCTLVVRIISLANASISQQLAQGDQTASLADYRTLRDKEKVKFPRDTMLEVCISLIRFAVLCQTLFQGEGPTNPLVEVLWRLVAAMQNSAPFIAERFQQMVRTPNVTSIYFASVLRGAVQVQAQEYLHLVATNVTENHEGIELPEFRSLVTDLKRETFPHSNNWVPIPEEYREAPRSSAGQTTGFTRAPSTAPTGASTVSTGNTTISALTDPTRAPMPRIANPSPGAEFSSIVVRAGGTRPILREHRPPQNDAGHEFCVAWWLRAGCFANCGHSATHGPFASPAERTRLLTYCRERLAAPATGNNA